MAVCSRRRLATILGLIGLLSSSTLMAQPPKSKAIPPTEEQTLFFETKVRPLLLSQCASCHGANEAKGGLRLDTLEGFQKGGTHGAVVSRQKPEESLLLTAISYVHPTLKMPPSGKLSTEQISILTLWIRHGATFVAYVKPVATPKLWSAQPLRKPTVPRLAKGAQVTQNPIDAFVAQKRYEHRLTSAPKATKRELLRRVYFDLIGLPPSPAEVQQFIADTSPKAYDQLIDRLLASPRYGERWARYWLDLVRYADSNGYERDAPKPYAWKYRDYVIRAFNTDLPYDRFLTEQVAGDEVPWRNEQSVTATGFLRLGTWDDEPNDALEYKFERLDDLVHATSTAFLALTVRCARCHDHKFDPISQKDYYAFGASFYAGYLDPGDGKLMGGPPTEKLGFDTIGFTDRGREAVPLHRLISGDPRRPKEEVAPGYLSLVTNLPNTVTPPPNGATTTHRRLQLAQWLTNPHHPLTARVLVNRIWQHHFGQGIVRTPNNFGVKGTPPTHPELLDWLASDFIEHGWSIKRLHRQMLLSETYQQASLHPKQALYDQKDAGNFYLWHFNRQRLDADALRDSMLAISGELTLEMGGEGFTPSVTREALEGLSRKGAEWNPSSPEAQRRRSIYMFLKRALIMPLMTTFDFADTTAPLEQRDVTTVAPQALALLNNPFAVEQGKAFAERVIRESGKDRTKQIERAWWLAFGRSPSLTEQKMAQGYLAQFRMSRQDHLLPTKGTLPSEGLRLWLRADKGLKTDASGHVSVWEDQSPQNNAFQQDNTDAQPQFVSNALRNTPAVRFDGLGRFFITPKQVLQSQQFTLFAVASDRATNGAYREIFSNWNRTSGNIGSSLFLGMTGVSNVRLSDAFAPAGSLSKPTEPFVLTGIAGSNGVVVFQNRREIARLASPLPPRNLAAPYVIGQQGNINGEFWNGDVFEIIAYDRALTDAERDQVWEALNMRYGITPHPKPIDMALASLCQMLMNTNEFLYLD